MKLLLARVWFSWAFRPYRALEKALKYGVITRYFSREMMSIWVARAIKAPGWHGRNFLAGAMAQRGPYKTPPGMLGLHQFRYSRMFLPTMSGRPKP